jgi:hypothetical protein
MMTPIGAAGEVTGNALRRGLCSAIFAVER